MHRARKQGSAIADTAVQWTAHPFSALPKKQELVRRTAGFYNGTTRCQNVSFLWEHLLWLAPEDPIRSYGLDDNAVEVTQIENGLLIRKPAEEEDGLQKSIRLTLNQTNRK
jgi:hypothetical protein